MSARNDSTGNLIDRTLATMRGRLRGWFDGGAFKPADDLPPQDAEALRARLTECLAAKGGEVSARLRAAELGRAYQGLNETGRRRYLTILARDFARDEAAFTAAVNATHTAADDAALRAALEAPRVQLLRQFNMLADGVKFLVDLRADLRRYLGGMPELAGLEADLHRLLAGWFDIGFLTLRRMDWNTPAALLEKLVVYEAVHQIRDWRDLKNRLDSDRRCYAFFHPNMPEEPLIFVEVALVNGLADNIQELLGAERAVGDPEQADTAIFYSISNTQTGLAGISFGDFLIKRVVDDLRAELPRIKTFATLSPMPGFMKWQQQQPASEVKQILARPNWWRDAALAAALKKPLMQYALRYLLTARRASGGALDSAAHFHLSNGAYVERLNWLADASANGLAQSGGLMINYVYERARIETNHERYFSEGRVALSAALKSLAKTWSITPSYKK